MIHLWKYLVQAASIVGTATASIAIVLIVGFSLTEDNRPMEEVLIAGGIYVFLLSYLIFVLWALSQAMGLWEANPEEQQEALEDESPGGQEVGGEE